MSEIKLITLKSVKIQQTCKILFRSCGEVRVISDRDDLRPGCSASGYLMLKSYYQKLEEMDQRKICATKHNFKEIEVSGTVYNVSKGNYSFEQIFALFTQTVKRNKIDCIYCSRPLSFKEASLDHYIPRAAGGQDKASNFKVSCLPCNRVKSSIHPYQDKKLFNFFLEFVNTAYPHPVTQKDFARALFNSDIFSSKEYPLFLRKISLPLSMRLNLAIKIKKEKIPFNPEDIFNFELIRQLSLDEGEEEKVRQIMEG